MSFERNENVIMWNEIMNINEIGVMYNNMAKYK